MVNQIFFFLTSHVFCIWWLLVVKHLLESSFHWRSILGFVRNHFCDDKAICVICKCFRHLDNQSQVPQIIIMVPCCCRFPMLVANNLLHSSWHCQHWVTSNEQQLRKWEAALMWGMNCDNVGSNDAFHRPSTECDNMCSALFPYIVPFRCPRSWCWVQGVCLSARPESLTTPDLKPWKHSRQVWEGDLIVRRKTEITKCSL